MFKHHNLFWLAVAVCAGIVWWSQMGTMGDNAGVAGPTSGSQAMPQSYLTALAKYEGNRFQFDMYCQAVPKSGSFKNGAKVMIDNRSGDARTIKIGGASYALAGYGWRIITLSSPTLPATQHFDCGTAVNVGTVILQK